MPRRFAEDVTVFVPTSLQRASNTMTIWVGSTEQKARHQIATVWSLNYQRFSRKLLGNTELAALAVVHVDLSRLEVAPQSPEDKELKGCVTQGNFSPYIIEMDSSKNGDIVDLERTTDR